MDTNGTTNGSTEKTITMGRCAANGTFHTLSKKELTTRRTKCPSCGKDIDIKDKHFTEDFTGMTIPNHNRLAPEIPEALAVPPAAAVDTGIEDMKRPDEIATRAADDATITTTPTVPSSAPAAESATPGPSTLEMTQRVWGTGDIVIRPSSQVATHLKELVASGLYGSTADQVAEELMLIALRDELRRRYPR